MLTTDLAGLAKALAEKLTARLRPPTQHAAKLRWMKDALDLRRMADTPAYEAGAFVLEVGVGNRSPLASLQRWMASRDAKEPSIDEDVPSLSDVETQFRLLCERLRKANDEAAFRRWKGASGVIIMKDVFSMPRFYEGCKGYLHLWLHCALKTMNESVVEGMGGVWDRSSPDARHCAFEQSVKEAVVAWNGPWPYHQEAVPFINHALNHLFGTKDWAQRFTHKNERTEQTPAWAQSGGKVVGRKKREGKGKLPSAMYDTAAA